MTLRLNGSTSGYTEIDAPAVAGSNTLVLPGGNGTADQALVTNGSGTLSFADRGRMVLETAQASTSGTSIDFTSIPSWVRRVTVMFSGVSTSGTSNLQIQIGDGSVVTTGYDSASYTPNNQNTGATTGFLLTALTVTAGTVSGTTSLFLQNSSTNAWVASGVLGQTTVPATNGASHTCGGNKALSGALDRIRITTVNGTDTFDAGSINLLLEG
jgi:hypothetical protein